MIDAYRPRVSVGPRTRKHRESRATSTGTRTKRMTNRSRDIMESDTRSVVGAEKHKPHPSYKESRVPWFPKIPAHWEVKRLKYLADFSTGWTPPTGQEHLYRGENLWANISDLGPRVLRTTEKTISDAAIQEARVKGVSPGSLLFSFKLSIGAVSIAGTKMYTNEAIAAFPPSVDIDIRYLYWAAPVLIPSNAQVNIYGAQLLNRERISNAPLVSPPRDEQRAIAAFLDRETAKIDALVAKKERLIELLLEKRTALITQAVTKGLDPDVPMRDSGIELPRRIPAHWHVKRVRDIADSLQTGPFGSQLHADEYTTHGTPVINPVNLVDGGLVPDFGCTVDAATRKRLQHHQLCCGDILFARRGEIGRCGLVTGQQEGWLCGTGCLRMRTKSGVAEPLFLLYGFSTGSIRGWLEIESVGSTMQNLNTSIIGRVPVAIPDLDEQRNLLKVLALETGRIDDLMASVREAIERLKELRTALISAAVTGKIDVRDAADANPRIAS